MSELRVGVISDTHGLLRPEAIAALRGSDLVIHAGDVGRPELIDALRAIAPLWVVRGNVDLGGWAENLPETLRVKVGAHAFHVLHDIAALAIEPAACGIAAIVYGHSHRPAIETRAGVLYLNLGSAGPRRFDLPVTVASVRVRGAVLDPEIIRLDVRS